MKKFSFLGVRNPFFVTVILAVTTLFSCSKSESAGGGTAPVPVPPTPVAATLSVTGGPSSTMWYGSNTVTYNVTATNAKSVTVSLSNGTQQTFPDSGGQLVLNNLTQEVTATFSTTVAAGVTTAKAETKTIPVLQQEVTILAKDKPNGWKNTEAYVFNSTTATWVSFTPACAKIRFNTDNTCNILLLACGQGNNSTDVFIVNGNKVTIADKTWTIEALTATSMTLLSANGTERRVYEVAP